jgi:hypothetical protein
MSYTANVGRQRTEFQNGVCCWVLAAGADARNLPRELFRRQATQRMRLHRTTTSHHPCTGAGQADAVEFSFFSPTTGEAYTPPIRTRLATSSRSDRPAPAAETCRACAVLGIMSRHVTPRCAIPGLFRPPSFYPAVAKHIVRVLHLQNQSHVVSSATPRHAAVCESGDLVSWPWMSARRRPRAFQPLRHTNFSSIALTCRDRTHVRIAVAGQVTVSSSVVRRCVLAAGWLPGARPRPPTAGRRRNRASKATTHTCTRARARARRQIKAS